MYDRSNEKTKSNYCFLGKSFRRVQFYNLPYPKGEKVGSQRQPYLQKRIECSFRNYFNPICDRSKEKTKSDYCFFGKSETILAVLRLNELVTLC